MAEERKKEESKKKPPEQRFLIYNSTRSRETRTMRAQAPMHAKTTLLLGAGMLRVMRARPLPVTESVIKKLRAELISKEAAGLLYVATARGLRVDLATLKEVERPKPTEPKPVKKLDSAADDDNANVGIPIPPYEGAIAQVQEAEPPSVGLPELPDSEEEPSTEEVMGVLGELTEEDSVVPEAEPPTVLEPLALPEPVEEEPPLEPDPEPAPEVEEPVRKVKNRKKRGKRGR